MDVAIIYAGISFIGSDDIGFSEFFPSGDGIGHVKTEHGIGAIIDVIVVGGIDSDSPLAEVADFFPCKCGNIECGDGVVFLKAHEQFRVIRRESYIFWFDVKIFCLGVGRLERGMVAQASDKCRHSAECKIIHGERTKSRAKSGGIICAEVDESDRARLLVGIELGDGAGFIFITSPSVLTFVSDGDFTAFDSDHVGVITRGKRADHRSGFKIEKYYPSDLWN